VAVEHGSFTMGSPGTEAGRYSYEVPHLVNLTHPFLLWPTPVTQDQFEALMGFNPSGAGSGPRLPVETVSWFEAVAFCNALSRKQQLDESYRIFDVKGTPGDKDYQFNVEWKGLTHPGYRLPTEAEWEYACRAGTTTATYNGDLREGLLEKEQPNPILDPIAWFYGNSGTGTHPVGELEANAWGLNDMLGNVYEWIWDWYGSYPSGAVADPSGPEGGSDRVFRGGSWSDYARLCRAADRYRLSSGCRDRYLGFRPARSRP
jgi:formylglycine-generating enzyme required for sulfatase activity